jgi:hypothetical protein
MMTASAATTVTMVVLVGFTLLCQTAMLMMLVVLTNLMMTCRSCSASKTY